MSVKFSFPIEEFADDNISMHCSTAEEANTFLAFLDSIGRKWCNGDSYLSTTHFDTYGADTCYFFNNGTFADIQYPEEYNYAVLEFSDFFDEELETDERYLDEFFSLFSLSY